MNEIEKVTQILTDLSNKYDWLFGVIDFELLSEKIKHLKKNICIHSSNCVSRNQNQKCRKTKKCFE